MAHEACTDGNLWFPASKNWPHCCLLEPDVDPESPLAIRIRCALPEGKIRWSKPIQRLRDDFKGV